MGLDISYYEKLTLDADIKLDEDGEPIDTAAWDTHTRIYTNPDFPERADKLVDGWYEGDCTGSFRAGSYGGYNNWRSQLCVAALGSAPNAIWEGHVTDGPFYELVMFSDCEGTIGPKTSAKLAKDFAEWEEKIGSMVSGDEEYFMEKFRDWKRAFEAAADTGAVCFH